MAWPALDLWCRSVPDVPAITATAAAVGGRTAEPHLDASMPLSGPAAKEGSGAALVASPSSSCSCWCSWLMAAAMPAAAFASSSTSDVTESPKASVRASACCVHRLSSWTAGRSASSSRAACDLSECVPPPPPLAPEGPGASICRRPAEASTASTKRFRAPEKSLRVSLCAFHEAAAGAEMERKSLAASVSSSSPEASWMTEATSDTTGRAADTASRAGASEGRITATC
mmetsp:Transcript_5600/g.15659  ORF Transcript_5600/g.15659 Transcript_5600/m.15659 type:complete len:229 (-) Transcript_5600:1244-1930(-)